MKAPLLRLPMLALLLLTARAAGPAREGDWFVEPKAAQKESMQTNRPQLVWFLDSVTSTECRRLENDVFTRPEFKNWFADKVVLLRVDRAPGAERDRELHRQHELLRTRYLRYLDGDPTRAPVFLLLNPVGGVIGDKTFPSEGLNTPDAFTQALQAFIEAKGNEAGDAPDGVVE